MKINYFTNLFFVAVILATVLVSADTTFFDNPDDFFIMGSSSTGEVTEGTTGRTTGGCLYKWECTNWSACLPLRKQIRNCTNIGTCPDTYKTPKTEQNCIYTFEGEIIIKGIRNKIFICFITILIIGSIIFYLKKDYFKKLIQKTRFIKSN